MFIIKDTKESVAKNMDIAVRKIALFLGILIFLFGTFFLVSALPPLDDRGGGSVNNNRETPAIGVCETAINDYLAGNPDHILTLVDTFKLCDYCLDHQDYCANFLEDVDNPITEIVINGQTAREERRDDLLEGKNRGTARSCNDEGDCRDNEFCTARASQRGVCVEKEVADISRTCINDSGCATLGNYYCYIENSAGITGQVSDEEDYPSVGTYCTSNSGCARPADDLDCNITTHKCFAVNIPSTEDDSNDDNSDEPPTNAIRGVCLPVPIDDNLPYQTTYSCGDINKDNKIDSADIDKIGDYVFGGQTPSNWDIVDLDGNSIVDAVDVVTLINYVKRQGPMPPCESNVVCDRYKCSGKRYAASKYACGNINMDDRIDLADSYLLGRVVFEGAQPAGWDSVDLNDDGVSDVVDVVTLTNYIYRNGTAPHCSYVFDCGDVNKDRKIDQGDLDKIQDYAFEGQEVPVGVNADLNGDNVIDVVDVVIMVDVAKRKIDSPSCIATTTCIGGNCDRTFNTIVEECGNINRDLKINSADIDKLVGYAFEGVPIPGNVKADLNADGIVDITDVVILVNYVKRDGEKPTCPATCVPKTCLQLGKQCGSYDDGCDGTVSCGTCSTGTCNTAVGQCQVTCTPKTCSQLGKQCGTVSNGCPGETVNCGVCSTGNCVDNQCVVPQIDRDPVIDVFTLQGSGIVEAYTTRVWNIKATDPQGGLISAKIEWDDHSGTSSIQVTKNSGETFNLQHEYPYYTNTDWNSHHIVLAVTDSEGLVATREMNIDVHYETGSNEPTGELVVTKPTAGTYKIGDVMNIIWTAPSTVSTVTIYGMKKLTTGAWDSNLIASNVPSSGGGQYNYLLGAAGTNIKVIGRDSATGDYLSDMSDAFTINNTQTQKPSFAIGSRVQVTTEVYPRRDPNGNNNYYDFEGNYIQQPQGGQYTAYYNNKGKILEGPSEAGGKTWFKVDFDTGTDGWMEKGHIKVINESNIPFAFTTDSLINPSTVYVGESKIWTLKGNVPSASASGCTGSQAVLYEVDFGDGTKTKYIDNCLGGIMGYAGESAMKHAYATNGSFNVSGKATSNITRWNGTATKTLRVTSSWKPIIITQITGTNIVNGMPTVWKVSTTGGAPGNFVFNIDWGSGAPTTHTVPASSLSSFSHTYTTLGNWNPKVKIIDSAGQTNEKYYVNPSSIQPP